MSILRQVGVARAQLFAFAAMVHLWGSCAAMVLVILAVFPRLLASGAGAGQAGGRAPAGRASGGRAEIFRDCPRCGLPC